MIHPGDSLLKYDSPVLLTKNTNRKSPKGRPLKVSSPQPLNATPVPPPQLYSASTEAAKQENKEILDIILPPREWTEGDQVWVQPVSRASCMRTDVLHLEELLNKKLQQRQARKMGICPIRREFYSQCFDELIRQVTISCAERGSLLSRVRDEIQVTMAAYQILNESSTAFGIRKLLQAEEGTSDMEKRILELENEKQELKKQLDAKKAKAKCDAEKREAKRPETKEEKRDNEEIQCLERANQQLKALLERMIAPEN